MYEMHFLRDIAEQNYSKYNIESLSDIQRGLTLSVSSAQNVGLAVARFYNTLDENVSFDTEASVTLPMWDPVAKGLNHYDKSIFLYFSDFVSDLTISATIACGKNGEIGLLGTDLYFSNIAEDITYYSNYEDYTYGFILTMEGLVVAHPSYPRPLASKKQPLFVNISYLEKVDNFTIVLERMLRDSEGFHILNNHNSTVRLKKLIYLKQFDFLLEIFRQNTFGNTWPDGILFV